jgi:hypothetical protein
MCPQSISANQKINQTSKSNEENEKVQTEANLSPTEYSPLMSNPISNEPIYRSSKHKLSQSYKKCEILPKINAEKDALIVK